ncbi:MAG: NUDIX hydrolase [Bacteroidales bacterium]|jgi:8-oxo-dGTP diphosphatase|nr:NUDIX hydrolase [Bacteroidales bacterium]
MPFCYEYPRPAVAADVIVFDISHSEPRVLLIKRKNPPYQGMWAFPGGFMDANEKVEETAFRELFEETHLKPNKLFFLGIYDDPNRDPRGRTIGIAYIAAFNGNINPKAGDDAAEIQWFPVNKLPPLAFDHSKIIIDALQKLSTLR